MEGKTFKFNLAEQKEDLEKDTKCTFSLVIPVESYVSFNNLINIKTREGDFGYNLKACILEGLERLKEKNPLVKSDRALQRRFYRGGEQKEKVESVSTSVVISREDINWIDNYILQERMENNYYSKPDFILDLVEELKIKYAYLGKNI